MAKQYTRNYFTDLALGNIQGHYSVNKFGAAPSGAQITATDIWSRANATPTQQIWLAPTAARVHAIVSSDALDTGFNVKLWGLKTWDTAETSETVALTGQVPVNTVNSYVIIHRMKIIPTAAKPVAVGTITATAAVDNTVTALIIPPAGEPHDGQTGMAIYGVPSTQTALLHSWYAQIDKATGVAASCDFRLRVNENPNIQTTGFLRKSDISVQSTGTNSKDRAFIIPQRYEGPCIIKIQAIASTADLDAEAGFALELVDHERLIP